MKNQYKAPYKFGELVAGDEFSYNEMDFVKIKRRMKGGEAATAIMLNQGKDKDLNLYTFVPDSIMVNLTKMGK
jgi:hypothetical protein